MRVAVFGAGGVGGYFAAALARAGTPVAVVARGAHLEAIRHDGIRVATPDGGEFVGRPESAGAPSELAPADVVLVAVKAWQVAEVAADVGSLIAEGGVAVPLCNGVEAADQLAAVVGRERVAGGLCKIMSRVAGPGRIEHIGATPTAVFGELDGRESDRLERLREALEAAGIAAEQRADIAVAMWEKFVFIAAIGGVGAASRQPIGVLRELPQTRVLLRGAMEEIRAVAIARGVGLDGEVVDRTMAFIDRLPPGGTSSMQRDLIEGRRSELESQNGAVVRLGREVGVPTPINETLWACLSAMEAAASR